MRVVGGGDSESFEDGGPEVGTLYDSRIIPKCFKRLIVCGRKSMLISEIYPK